MQNQVIALALFYDFLLYLSVFLNKLIPSKLLHEYTGCGRKMEEDKQNKLI